MPRWTIRPTQASATFVGGESIDLGNRVLTVIHTPGHSHDSICLLDEHNGILLTGDTVGYGALYAHWPDSDPDMYAQTLDMLEGLGAFRLMLAAHYPHVIADAALLGDLAESMARVCSGDAPRVRVRDILGNEVFESRFDYFFITTPVSGGGWRARDRKRPIEYRGSFRAAQRHQLADGTRKRSMRQGALDALAALLTAVTSAVRPP